MGVAGKIYEELTKKGLSGPCAKCGRWTVYYRNDKLCIDCYKEDLRR